MGQAFQDVWPELERGLHNSLRYQGAGPEEADDIVQETALRLFRMWDEVDDSRSPKGLAFTIAWNLLRDERRKRRYLEVVSRLPEEIRDDVERAGLARLELGRVLDALATLDSTYRRALLAEIFPFDVPHRTTSAIRMVRMRARKRLASLLEAASGFAIHSGVRWRRFINLSQEALRTSVPVAGGSVAVLGAAFAFSFMGDPVEVSPRRSDIGSQARPPVMMRSNDLRSISFAGHGYVADADAVEPRMSSGYAAPTSTSSRQDQQAVRIGVGNEDGPRAGGSVRVSPGGVSSVPYCGARLHLEINVGIDCTGDVGGRRVEANVELDTQEL